MDQPSPAAQKLAETITPLVKSYELFAERCLKIKTKAGGIAPLVFNKTQRYVHGMLEAQRARTGKVRAVVVKQRQGGVSTYVEGRFYHRTTTHFGQRAFILTHLDEATQNIFGITKRYHTHCPYPMKRAASADSANQLKFDVMDSEFSVATARSKGTGRSATAQLFHGSEVAFWENAAEHMAGIGQVIPNDPGTEIILESTGNGEGNLFHSMSIDAMRGVSDYILIFTPWFWTDEYRVTPPEGFVLDGEEAEYAARYALDAQQMAWRRGKVKDDFRGDTALFDQEYPAEVLLAFRRQAEESYISSALVAKCRRARLDPVEYGASPRIMGIDPAEYGPDSSVLILRQGRKVFPYKRYHGKKVMELVGLAAKQADEWKPDFINVDSTGIGSGVAGRLEELGYPVVRVVFGERAADNEQYVLVRDEIWGDMKAHMEEAPYELPDDDSLQYELTGPTYTYDSSRRLKLESKEHMKNVRKVRSPDGGDALACTYAVRTAGAIGRKKLERKRRRNWRA